jgi:hypothetical protein
MPTQKYRLKITNLLVLSFFFVDTATLCEVALQFIFELFQLKNMLIYKILFNRYIYIRLVLNIYELK